MFFNNICANKKASLCSHDMTANAITCVDAHLLGLVAAHGDSSYYPIACFVVLLGVGELEQ